MSSAITSKLRSQLWGIYHTDREYAQSLGDPLRTTVEAPTKIAAEEAAAKLGFTNPWAHPIAPEVASLTTRILRRQSSTRQERAHKSTRGIRA
jgi:hypothetical protein